MKNLLYLFRKTLFRRVVLALMLAFLVAFPFLLLQDYIFLREGQNIDVRASGANLLASLSHIDNPDEARTAIAVLDHLYSEQVIAQDVPLSTVFQLLDREGNKLYVSGDAAKMAVLENLQPQSVTTQVINGRSYRVYHGVTKNWSFTYANQDWTFLAFVIEMSKLRYPNVITEFVVELILVWIAVSGGLAPLKRLSKHISARGEDDLSALMFDPKYDELKPVVTSIESLLTQLRNKVSREHAFVQDAAHELRTPMAVISAQAHVLALANTSEDRLKAEKSVDLAIARASHLVRQLLQLARIDCEHPLVSEPLDVAQLVRNEMALIAPVAMVRNIDLSLDAPQKLPATLEKEAFQSILNNLLDNAIRYIQNGGQIAVELLVQNAALNLTVSDNGPGISEHERSLIFERFYRGAGHDATGSGLGLAIVKQAAERLGGKVWLSSGADGVGCQFTLTIPS